MATVPDAAISVATARRDGVMAWMGRNPTIVVGVAILACPRYLSLLLSRGGPYPHTANTRVFSRGPTRWMVNWQIHCLACRQGLTGEAERQGGREGKKK